MRNRPMVLDELRGECLLLLVLLDAAWDCASALPAGGAVEKLQVLLLDARDHAARAYDAADDLTLEGGTPGVGSSLTFAGRARVLPPKVRP